VVTGYTRCFGPTAGITTVTRTPDSVTPITLRIDFILDNHHF